MSVNTFFTFVINNVNHKINIFKMERITISRFQLSRITILDFIWFIHLENPLKKKKKQLTLQHILKSNH